MVGNYPSAASNHVYYSSDGGSSWSRILEQSNYENPIKTAFADPLHGWVICNNGGLLYTSTGGK
jgi:photosystem II stability/assembly factor-like uncharacterized protein